MSQKDTIRLGRQCGAGIKMAVSALDTLTDKVSDQNLKQSLQISRMQHIKLGQDLKTLLDEYGAQQKEPGIIAKGMARMKTGLTLAVDESDESIADLITDGCNMGIKGLNRFLNKFSTADPRAKDITVKLYQLEEKLVVDLRPYL